MVPIPCRILLALAGLIVPRKNRAEWRREWDAELAYRQRSGASLSYMVRCARGSFRDAAWIRAQTPFSLAFLTAPLRAECLGVAIAFGACLWFGALTPPHPSYANLARLVRFERSLGILDITLQYGDAPLLWRWRTAPSVEQIATYTIAGDSVPYARVSPNFFEVLGTKAARGRLLDAQDLSNAVVLTNDFWRSRFRSDAGVLGSSFSVGYKTYTIAGVLPPGFAFRGVKMFAPLKYASFPSAIALLRPGVSPSQARTELYRIALQGEPEWMSRGIRLRPLASRVTATGFVMAACLLALALAYLGLRRRAAFYIWARIAAILLFITVFDLATMRAVNHFSVLLSFLQVWTYLPLCAAAIYLTLRDQRSRCPRCFGRLKMPVPIGSWSSLIIDRVKEGGNMYSRREILAALAAVPSVVVAEDKPDFSGRWRLDPARSSREAPAGLTETIDHRDPVVRIDSDWDRHTATGLTNTALLAPTLQLVANGAEVSNSMPLGMTLVGKSRWSGQTLITEWRIEGLKAPFSGTWQRRMNGPDMILDATTQPGGARRFVFTRANP